MGLNKIHSIKTKLYLLLLITTLVLGLMLVGMTSGYFINTAEKNTLDLELNLSSQIDAIDEEINILGKGALALASVGTEFYNYSDKTNTDIAFASTSQFFETFDSAIGGGIWFTKGHLCQGAYVFHNGIAYVQDRVFPTLDFHSTTWYKEIYTTLSALPPFSKQEVWTAPYRDIGGTEALMLTVGAGIYDTNGDLVGISTIDWLLEDVVTALKNENLRPTKNSFVVLADINDDYIISCTLNDNYTGKKLSYASFLNDFEHNNSTIMQSSTQKLKVNDKDKKFIVNDVTLSNGIAIMSCIPRGEFYSNLNISITVIVISFAIILSLAFLFVRNILKNSITTPIQILTRGAKELGSGNFEHNIDLKSEDELSVLAKSFNKMTGDLKTYMEKLTEETGKRMAIGAELNVATDIQNSMLPALFPAFPERYEIDLYAKMQPAKEVGGDFYDFFLIDSDHLALTIADVSGKGIPAALFMVITKTLLKTQGLAGLSPKKILETVNNQLCENNNACMFVTNFFAILEISSGNLVYSNAGHNPIAIKRKNEGYKYLESDVGFILAGMEDLEYTEATIQLKTGDSIVFYTDGVTEALNKELELYGEDRLIKTLDTVKTESARKIVNTIFEDIEVFANGADQADDITMLVLNYNGVPNFKNIELDANIENMDTLIDFISDYLKEHNITETQTMQMSILCDEIFANICSYAYPDNKGKAEIFIHVDEDIIMEFTDSGIEYNPLQKAPPNLLASAEERDIGGLGIEMVKMMTDNMYYRYADKKNILTLVKSVQSEDDFLNDEF